MPIIDLIRGDKIIGSYVINKKMITVGRSRENIISIANKAISRFHARIELLDNGYILTDLNSLNGSFLNDARVQRALVTHNDRLTVGPYTILFKITSDALPQPNDMVAVKSDALGDASETMVQSDAPLPAPIVAEKTDTTATPAILIPEQQPDSDTKSQTGSRSATVIIKEIEKIIPPENQVSLPIHDTKSVTMHGDTNQLECAFARIPLVDKIKKIIEEKAFISEDDIQERLAMPEFGTEKIADKKLKTILKELNLDTPLKRYQFFKQF